MMARKFGLGGNFGWSYEHGLIFVFRQPADRKARIVFPFLVTRTSEKR